LVELSQIDTFVATGYVYIVHPADVVLQLYVATFLQGLDSGVDFVYGLAQCCPSVTCKRKNDLETIDGK